MLVLGIVGSPRKNGRTNALVDAALAGAESNGARARKIYLADHAIRPLGGSTEDLQGAEHCPDELSALCEEADAIALGAPVYYGDINGLTKDFMDSVRIASSNGKPALGFAIAGGSGKGLLSGVQTIYHFFYHRQMRGVDPTPVSRFNFRAALDGLSASGARLADMARDPCPFPGATRDDRWADVLAYYTTIGYLNCDPVDEFVMLVRQLIAVSEEAEADSAQTKLDQALALIADGKREAAARLLVRAYEALYFPS